MPLHKAAKIDYQKSPLLYLIAEKIPLFFLAMILSAVTFLVQRKVGAMRIAEGLSFGFRVSNALVSYIKYIGKMVYPRGLAVLYPYQRADIPIWQPSFAFIILVCVSLVVIYAATKKRYLLVGWLWYLGTLIPVIGLVQTGGQTMADRYTYLPSVGIFIIVVFGIVELYTRFIRRKIVPIIITAVVLVALLVCTRIQVKRWKDDFTLFGHALAVTKNNYVMHNNYGVALSKVGKIDEATTHFEEAIQINPFYSNAYRNLGIILLEQDRFNGAIACFTKILSIRTDWPDVYYYLGLAYARSGKYEHAIQNYTEALQLNSEYADAHKELGFAFVRSGNFDSAIRHYSEALRLRPGWIETMNNLAWLLATAEEGKFRNSDKAVELAEQACELTKNREPILLDTLAAAYASGGRFDEAIKAAEKAIKLAEESGQKELIDKIRGRLSFYRIGRPYIKKTSTQDKY